LRLMQAVSCGNSQKVVFEEMIPARPHHGLTASKAMKGERAPQLECHLVVAMGLVTCRVWPTMSCAG